MNVPNILYFVILLHLLTFVSGFTGGLLRPFGKATFIKARNRNNVVPMEFLVQLSVPFEELRLQALEASVVRGIGKQSILRVQRMEPEAHSPFVVVTADFLAVNKLRQYKYIRAVEESQTVTKQSCSCSTQDAPTNWGLDRIDQISLPLSTSFGAQYPMTSNVDIYILDTGVFIGHSDLKGRASLGANTANTNDADVDGHGTHVAGIAAGFKYGVAKTANIISVKVLGDDGTGSTANVAMGIGWVIAHRSIDPSRRGIMNLSLGGDMSPLSNALVDWAKIKGTLSVVAAGNSRLPASLFSPGSSHSAVTVGCSTQSDQFCSFSNWGLCVNIIAPGHSITSAHKGGGQVSLSGTSMSAPFVAGVLANYLACNPAASSDQALDWMYKNAQSKVSGVPLFTTNKLLYASCTTAASQASPVSFMERAYNFIKSVITSFGMKLEQIFYAN